MAPKSKLAGLFDGSYDLIKHEDGRVFLDRNGEIFGHLLDYLRSEKNCYPSFGNEINKERLFEFELKYWGINYEASNSQSSSDALEDFEKNE